MSDGGRSRSNRPPQGSTPAPPPRTGYAHLLRYYRLPLFLVGFAVVYGVLGYWLVAGWSFGDALYMTVITLSTVGFEEVQPLQTGERLFTISLILVGVGAAFTSIGLITEHAASGELGRDLRRLRMNRDLARLEDHVIVCGHGRVGRATVHELVRLGVPTLVIDVHADPADREARGGDVVWLAADATEEATLQRGGIERARALITAIGSDAVNVYITLTARILNPDLNIIALATDPASQDRLLRAGADRVTSLSAIGAHNLASHAVSPNLADFIDLSTASSEEMVQEVTVAAGSPLEGMALQDLRGTRSQVQPDQVAVVGWKRRGGPMTVSPPMETVLGEGDVVILWGSRRARRSLLE